MRHGFELTMLNPLPKADFWQGRRVLVTGHSGFVGGWASFWLHRLGARVSGYALPPITDPNFHSVIRIPELADETIADIRDLAALRACVARVRPQIVFHLAAQPIVRQAYRDPVETFGTNVMGTVNLLDTLRGSEGLEAIIVFTTDKVYRNLDWPWPYRESDALGGDEPYSASKSSAELVCEAFRNSYFKRAVKPVPVLAVRAGNIIGGGDWSADRLLPDAVRAFAAGGPLILRNPDAVRPWQHVLEPVRGMLALAEAAVSPGLDDTEGWNMGPAETQGVSVGALADIATGVWGKGALWRREGDAAIPEANLLTLDSHRIAQAIGWRTIWPATTAVERSIAWYRDQLRGAGMRNATAAQIDAYADDVRGGNS
ncbi:CDP-glucose 4,6-dehydratase [Dongia sp.]|uniref:CDP-glucose 4,6-dehydratase n=1 Tax=Dongia sp. TaxID=1977262 RepID=UPI0035AE95D1